MFPGWIHITLYVTIIIDVVRDFFRDNTRDFNVLEYFLSIRKNKCHRTTSDLGINVNRFNSDY